MNARAVVLPLLTVGIAATLWYTIGPPAAKATPAATWRVGPPDDFRQARNYDELAPDTPLRLSFTASEARHVYVMSNSAEDGTLLMFPSPVIAGSPSNPLPPGRTVLPGEHDGAAVAWTTRAEIRATTTYVVVASREPVAELEALLPRLRRWSNKVLPNGSMQVTNPDGEVELAGNPRGGWPAAVLSRAADRSLAETVINGPLHEDPRLDGVWTASFRVKERRPPAAKPQRSRPKPDVEGR